MRAKKKDDEDKGMVDVDACSNVVVGVGLIRSGGIACLFGRYRCVLFVGRTTKAEIE
jgi:hypothetical protein